MNISTGGPHILLFERDQQLTALINSEFQLAGYECHTARTAVEVFDALARYPIRIVLVDLAQAAAARREFWVALDTQRRGRGIHVLTFHCTNIAGYGPQDPDDRAQNVIADLDIDGMLGLMKLVDEVRMRVPGSTTSTLPRIPRATPPQAVPSPTVQGAGASASSSVSSSGTSSGTASLRTSPTVENTGSLATPRSTSGGYVPSPANTAATSLPTNGMSGGTTVPTSSTAGAKSVSYTDKIRAVLYPNQRNWTTQMSPSVPPQEPRVAQDTASNTLSTLSSLNNITVGASATLQRLADVQQESIEGGQVESGLAQLSRLAQASQDNNRLAPNTPQPESISPMRPYAATEQSPVSPRTTSYTPTGRINENIGVQPLRASPIQDIPVDRPGNKTGGEGNKRPEILSHTNYGQPSAPLSSLASIATPSTASTTVPVAAPVVAQASTAFSAPVPQVLSPLQSEDFERDEYHTQAEQELAPQMPERANDDEQTNRRGVDVEPNIIKQQSKPAQGAVSKEQVNKEREEASVAQHQNTMLFDIMQSLPPMPPVVPQPMQSIQAQVVNGRATRSLGSVLLAGHLVPQNRLEVAESIQRMLRGVDLNYQLGEILLMFKLLTPDQLLAASLVSYGMITTTQISALGRIRQELHAIGLEYDLESLLILFRILTPEQLREAKSASQG